MHGTIYEVIIQPIKNVLAYIVPRLAFILSREILCDMFNNILATIMLQVLSIPPIAQMDPAAVPPALENMPLSALPPLPPPPPFEELLAPLPAELMAPLPSLLQASAAGRDQVFSAYMDHRDLATNQTLLLLALDEFERQEGEHGASARARSPTRHHESSTRASKVSPPAAAPRMPGPDLDSDLDSSSWSELLLQMARDAAAEGADSEGRQLADALHGSADLKRALEIARKQLLSSSDGSGALGAAGSRPGSRGGNVLGLGQLGGTERTLGRGALHGGAYESQPNRAREGDTGLGGTAAQISLVVTPTVVEAALPRLRRVIAERLVPQAAAGVQRAMMRVVVPRVTQQLVRALTGNLTAALVARGGLADAIIGKVRDRVVPQLARQLTLAIVRSLTAQPAAAHYCEQCRSGGLYCAECELDGERGR